MLASEDAPPSSVDASRLLDAAVRVPFAALVRVRPSVIPSVFAFAVALVCLSGSIGPALPAADLEVNGDFEAQSSLGWTEWSATWAAARPTYDYAMTTDPAEGESAFYQKASDGSFGVYQEVCVEPGQPVTIEWAWKGRSGGNGWWEVIILDAPYSYDAVDDPGAHPETSIIEKWETGFGGALPEPSEDWTDGGGELTPSGDVVTLVLKCGSTEGGLVEAWFDDVRLTQDTTLLEVTGVAPPMGKTAGGEAVTVTGRVFPEGSVATIGGKDLVEGVRLSSCSLGGQTPPGEPGLVDVVVTAPSGGATLAGAFRYVAPPAVTTIAPSSGPVEGGTEVTIEGESFVAMAAGGIGIRFGSRDLANPVVEGETTIRGTTPPGDAGPVDVTVTTPFGEIVVEAGFTYETSEPPFVRGNCDGDADLNITDAIFLLGYLFLGTAEPSCLEGCNSDDDDQITITDAIIILGFLFTGGAPPAPPYPDCGTDPTEGLGCATAHVGC